MTYVLMHIDDAEVENYDWRTTDPLMDVSILVPPAETKLCTIVPLGAVARFLPILEAAVDPESPLRCDCCGALEPDDRDPPE